MKKLKLSGKFLQQLNEVREVFYTNSYKNSGVVERQFFNETFRSVLDAISDGVLVVDLSGQVLYSNKIMRQFWNLSTDDVASSEILLKVHDQLLDPVTFLKRVKEIYADKHVESYDIVERRDKRVFERLSKPLFVGQDIIGRVWTYREITEKIEVEKSLIESQKKHKIISEAEQRHAQALALLDRVRTDVNDVLDLASLFRDVIDGIGEAYGYTHLSLYLVEDDVLKLQYQIGYNQVIKIVHPNTSVSWRAIRTKKPLFIEQVDQDPDFLRAIPGIVSQICIPLFVDQSPVGVLNIESVDNQKLTVADFNLMIALGDHLAQAIGRVRMITEIKIQEQRLQKIFKLAPIGMAICELDGTFLQVNRAFENNVGYSEQELRQFKFSHITHHEDLDNNLDWLNRLVSGEIDNYRFEKRYIRKDGSIAPVILQVSLFFDSKQQPLYLLAQIIDISDLKTAEFALLQKQKMESIGVLAGGIAHDFNNLLVALTAQSALALKKLPTQSAARKHIEKSQQAAESATQLINQLLAYSGKGQFEIIRINLNKEIRQNIHLFQVAIPKNVIIKTLLDANLPIIMADAVQIQQLLMNLIINGAEAVGKQAGSVTIVTEQKRFSKKSLTALPFILSPPAPGNFVMISVRDDGIGMEPETASKIFDPFFTTKVIGRGLGLAAVLGIMRSHNGGLILESEFDKGTDFQLYFPIAAKQGGINEKNVDAEDDAFDDVDGFKKVLVIDDDSVVQEAVGDILELKQIGIINALDGRMGIELFKSHLVDIGLVLLDLSMPGISSRETLISIKDINPKIPIILCSGYSEHEINETFSGYQYEAFIQKPFEIDQLLNTAVKLMRK